MPKPSSKQRRQQRQQRKQKREQNEQQQPSAASSAAAVLPDNILQSIFANLKPKIPLGSTGTLMLKQLERLQKVAGVNRQWRATATQMFYRVAVVVISEPIYEGDYDDTRVRTNIRLVRNMRRVDSVREVQIAMEGEAQSVHDLSRYLNASGLGGFTWPGVVRLHFDVVQRITDYVEPPERLQGTNGLKILNKLLSRALPSLRQIIFEGVYAPAYYECNPIMPLIIERLYGPNPLTMLRIDSTFALDLKGREHQNPSHPIAIERLKLYGLHSVGNNNLPLVLASTLVHLTLGEIRVDWFWNSFVAGAASDSADGGLVFSCLKSLHMYFPKPEVRGHQRNVTDFHESRHAEDLASDTERESRSYITSSTFGRPRFPALTTLAIAFFPRSYARFLSLFTASPISWLYLCHAAYNAPSGIDLSQFIHLRSLEVQFIDDVTKKASRHVNRCLSDMFESTGSRLERLDMKLKATDAFKLRITASHAFAHNIRALQLDDHITIDDIVLILPHLPSLERLEIGAHAQRPIESLEELIRVFRAAEAAEQLTPLNTSLKLLRVWPSRYYMSQGDTFPRTLARSPVSFYFNLFVELVCRLPALEIMRVNISPMDWLHSTIQALLDSGIASEQIEHLRRLQIRPVAN